MCLLSIIISKYGTHLEKCDMHVHLKYLSEISLTFNWQSFKTILCIFQCFLQSWQFLDDHCPLQFVSPSLNSPGHIFNCVIRRFIFFKNILHFIENIQWRQPIFSQKHRHHLNFSSLKINCNIQLKQTHIDHLKLCRWSMNICDIPLLLVMQLRKRKFQCIESVCSIQGIALFASN